MKKKILFFMSFILLLASVSFASDTKVNLSLVENKKLHDNMHKIEIEVLSQAEGRYYFINYLLYDEDFNLLNKKVDKDFIGKEKSLNINLYQRLERNHHLEIYISDGKDKVSNTIKIKKGENLDAIEIVEIEDLEEEILQTDTYVFPNYIKVKYSDGKEGKSLVTWNYQEKDITKPGSYEFFGKVKSSPKEARLKLNVRASDRIIKIDDLERTIDQGDSINLPKRLLAYMENGDQKYVGVDWQLKDLDTQVPGTYTIQGQVENYGEVSLRLIILPIDLDKPINFKNKELEEILQEDLSKQQLTRRDLLEIKDLSLEYSHFENENLEELNYLKNLENLNFSFYFGNLDLNHISNLVNLKKIDLFNCKIENIMPIANLDKLEELNLGQNNISDISPLEDKLLLKKLRLSGNPIRDYSILLDIYDNLDEKDFEIEVLDFTNKKLVKRLELGELYYLPTKVLINNKVEKVIWPKDFVKGSGVKTLELVGKSQQGPLTYTFEITDDYEDKIINFPDKKLEAGVRKAIDKPKGDIYISDVRNLENLEVLALGVKDLTGIEHFKGLKKLSLWSNYVGSDQLVKLKGLVNLESLDLAANRLTDIPSGVFNNMDNLKELVLDNNQISNIDLEAFKGLNQLEDLLIEENRLSDISSVRNLKSLKKLFLRSNFIVNIEAVRDLTELEDLWLEDNKIKNIDSLKNLKNLQWLNINNNNISSIEALKDLDKLLRLKMNDNNIKDISALETKNLEWFMANNNKISDLSPLRTMKNIKYLELKNNKIKNINPLRDLVNIRIIYLSGNQIEDYEVIRHYAEDLNARDFDFN